MMTQRVAGNIVFFGQFVQSTHGPIQFYLDVIYEI